MIGHRTYLDLGRRTVPSTPPRRAIGARWHKRWSNPPAIVDRNGNRRDRETGLGPKDESDGAGTAIAQKGSV